MAGNKIPSRPEVPSDVTLRCCAFPDFTKDCGVFETSGKYPVTQSHIPEELNLLHHPFQNLKHRKCKSFQTPRLKSPVTLTYSQVVIS
jgi:hypothetical protein